jgi:hypothetical protein
VTWALEADLGSWDPLARTVTFLIGVALLIITGMSIVRTMVIPRISTSWLFAVIVRSTDAVFTGAARLMRTYRARDRVLAWSGPLGIVAALIVWLTIFLTAYALMIFGVTDVTINAAFLQAGSGLLTLGLIGTPGESVTILDFFAAMTGPAVIALLIGFLPTLYQAYLAREARVLLDTSVSGAPEWGPEFLVRIKMLEGEVDLPKIFAQWIPWAAQVRLTQTLYPSLSRFRSAVSNRNWLIALMSALDAAALSSAISKDAPDPRTVTLLQEGTQAILSIDAAEIGLDSVIRLRPWERRLKTTLSVFGVEERDPHKPRQPDVFDDYLPRGMQAVSEAVTLDSLRGQVPSTRKVLISYERRESSLTREEFDYALDYIASAGVVIERDRDEAFEIFRRIRGRYESAAYHLAERFYLPPAPWSGPRHPDTPVIWPTLAGKLSDT